MVLFMTAVLLVACLVFSHGVSAIREHNIEVNCRYGIPPTMPAGGICPVIPEENGR